MAGASLAGGFPMETKSGLKAADMGVRDINFFGSEAKDSLVCYERTLEIIEKNKARYDRNAGEA